MAELTDAEFDAANERGKFARANKPRALKARYDRGLGMMVVDFTNGCTFSFPPRLAQGLETATDDQITRVEILGQGYGLHWEELDVDLSVSGLIAGIFGTKAYMADKYMPRDPVARAAAVIAKATGEIKAEAPNMKSIRAGHDRTLTIAWRDGSTSTVDIGSYIRTYAIFAPLRTDDAAFRKVRLGKWGWCAHWSDDMEISSDTLWNLAHD
jgi:hypothetical protein